MAENKKNKKNVLDNNFEEMFEDWGVYMDYKKNKLEEQYREEAAIDFKEASSLFKGIAIFVNGYTNPPSDELRRLMMAHGGIYHHYLRPGLTTHMIATNLPYSKIIKHKTAQNPLPLCKPEWIMDSIKEGRVLDYSKYLLYSQHTKTQPKLMNMFDKLKPSNYLNQATDIEKEIKNKISGSKEEKKITSSNKVINKINGNIKNLSIYEKPQSTMIEEKKEIAFNIKTSIDIIHNNKNRKKEIVTSTQKSFSQRIMEINDKMEFPSILDKPQSTLIEKSKEITQQNLENMLNNIEDNNLIKNVQTKNILVDMNDGIEFASILEKPQSTMLGKTTEINSEVNKPKFSHRLNENHKTDHISKESIPSIEKNCSKNAEFLTEFYNNSRLHHIATMGAMFKDYINDLRDKNTGVFSGLKKIIDNNRINRANFNQHVSDSDDDMFESNDQKVKQNPVIMHIDMDCFFVSVGLRNHPELRGYPIAVAHAKGNKTSNNDEEIGSMSEIASCSYEARKAGVKNGMFLGQALKLCPKLKTIRYDFDGYKDVSYALYNIVASYTLQIEAVSCDEMYVDCSELLQKTKLSSMKFANILRNEIKEKTGCPVSTGFGNNKLQARLATKKAKPDGQFHLKVHDVEHYVGSLAVKDLPGVGYSTSMKLKQMNIKTCSDLQKVTLFNLQSEFGKKTGELLYNMCRGIDNSKLNTEHVRKSVSAEVNYGIRFENEQDAIIFLKKLSLEVCNRLKNANSIGRNITLKLMIRSKEAPKETAKFMGHGECDYLTKTKNLMTAVNDVSIITKEIISLWHQVRQIPEEIRGIGIQISKLESIKNKTSSSTILNFVNKAKNIVNDPIPSTSNYSSVSIGKSSKIENEKKQIISQGVNLNIPSSKVNIQQNKSNINIRNIQTKQEDYLKKTKPSISRNKKLELPSLQEIDMNVLVELPEDIRNEILNEYKLEINSDASTSKKTIVEQYPEKPVVNKHLQKVTMVPQSTDVDVSFSQVDPEFLAALSEDIKNDVKIYCQMKKKEKEMQMKKSSNNQKWNIFNQDNVKASKKRKYDKLTTVKEGNNTGYKKSKLKCSEIKNTITVKNSADDVGTEKDSQDKKNYEETNKNDCTIYFENKKFLIDDHKVEENKEILTTLVNCMLNLPIEQAKMQIQAWILNSKVISDIDFLSIVTYLGMLPKKKRIEDLHILLKTMNRCVTKLGNCVWHETYKKIVEHIQYNMQLEYNSDLMLPPMRCNRCTR